MNKKVEAHLKRKRERLERRGLLRETVLLDLSPVPSVQRLLAFVAEGLLQEVAENRPDAKRLGESVRQARLRMVGKELRHLVEYVGMAAGEDDPEGDAGDAADRRLGRWAVAQQRELLRLAVRFERRLGVPPEVKGAREKRRSRSRSS